MTTETTALTVQEQAGGLIMNKSEILRLAKKAIEKRWDFEQLKYGDDLYGKECFADDVWEFVEECGRIGTVAFNVKYP